jgi:hypothetical protein
MRETRPPNHDERFFTCEIVGGVFASVPLAYDDRPGVLLTGATLREYGRSVPWAVVGEPGRLSAADVLPGDAVEIILIHEFPLNGFQNREWFGVVLEKGDYVATLERCLDATSALRRAAEVKREGMLGR